MFPLLALASAPALQCPAENAHYVLRNAAYVSAYFIRVDSGPDWPSGLALAVHSSKTGETSWWLPWSGGTDNRQNIASTTDVTVRGWKAPNPDGGPRPHGDRQYVGTDANYEVIDHVPRRGEPAPAHILIPDGASSKDAIFIKKQFLDLVSCSATRS